MNLQYFVFVVMNCSFDNVEFEMFLLIRIRNNVCFDVSI